VQQIGAEAAIVGDDRQAAGRVMADFARQREKLQRQFQRRLIKRDFLGP